MKKKNGEALTLDPKHFQARYVDLIFNARRAVVTSLLSLEIKAASDFFIYISFEEPDMFFLRGSYISHVHITLN